MRFTLRCFASSIRPLVNLVTTLFFQRRRRSRSICGAPKTIPFSPISAASSMTLAACSRAFDGMQPTFRHTPPSIGQRSINVTLRPKSAARNAAVYPPTPAPSTTTSTAPPGAALTALLAVFGLLTGVGAAVGVGAGAGAGAGSETGARADAEVPAATGATAGVGAGAGAAVFGVLSDAG